jgi:diguanylate cyclase (GGDEF)-like protein
MARMGYWESQSATATDCWISPELAALYEFETPDGFVSIAAVRERFLPESRKVLEEHYAGCWAWGLPYAVQARLRRSDGSLLDCVVHGEPQFDAHGQVRHVSGIVRDVTEETSALRRVAESEQRLADFVSTASDWCWESDTAHRLLPYPKSLDGNAAFQTVASGGSARWELAYAPEDGEAMAQHRADMEAHRTFRDFTYTVIGQDGSRVSICTSGKPIFTDGGAFLGYRGTASDITQLREAQRQLEQLAYSDPLTGLANRALFKRELAALIGRCALDGRSAALLLIDLDRFKEVNDSLGHAAGDELLIRVAGVLRQDLGPRAFIARLGGDEFAVLVEGRDTSDVAMTRLADHLIDRLSGPVDLTEGEAFVGATIGIARLPEHGAAAETAVRNADLALYMAKAAGRGRARLFEPVYAQAVDQKLDLARHLRHAVEAGTLKAHYQPQVNLSSGRVTGFEALLRWTHPERGPISPAEFIPIAESSGLIVDLGLWMLREACRQGRAWLDAGLPPRSISVNVSPAQIWNVDFETEVAAVLAETGLPAKLLCLELTENLFVDHTEQRISRTLTALSGLGARLALDDFGSGYSSLGYLTRLPFDLLKVDRAFVDGISTAPEKRKLLGGIIALSHGLGMTVVAEGAELPAELDVLGGLDCDVVQGFVFSPPIAPDSAPLVAAQIEREPCRIQPKRNRL